MIQIGKINRLTIKETSSNAVYLEGGTSGDVLLTDQYSAQRHQAGKEIDVFVYVDKDQRLLATTHKPYAMVGEFAKLRVVATSTAGAFLGWGLENDLFVPKSGQQKDMREGKSYVVFIFLSEKTKRIAASSKLEKFLNLRPPEYSEGEEVDLLLYSETDLGYAAIINSSHTGIIYKNEVFQKLVIGQRLKGYVKKVREDLKIDLRLQQAGYQRVEALSKTILDAIQDAGGTIAVTDKSPPEEIYALFGVSKKVFKKAIGDLYKQRLISINDAGIKRVL